MQHPRVAIVGTAQSWTQTAWNDPGLWIKSLNDAYRLNGFQRADEWYDLHPVDRFWSPPVEGQPVYSHQIPDGSYVRPTGHLEWLARQATTIPVWLNPGYRTQHPPAATWPHAHPFPKAEIEAHFGRYFTSSPAWMMAQAIMDGVTELQILGIHLASEFEYRRQRPNFEYLCGRLLGAGKVTLTVRDGLRRYESPQAMLVLPESSPVLQDSFQYAFEPRPDAGLERVKWEQHKYTIKRERAIAQLKTAPWWRPTRAIQAQLWEYEAHLADAQDQLVRATIAGQWG